MVQYYMGVVATARWCNAGGFGTLNWQYLRLAVRRVGDYAANQIASEFMSADCDEQQRTVSPHKLSLFFPFPVGVWMILISLSYTDLVRKGD